MVCWLQSKAMVKGNMGDRVFPWNFLCCHLLSHIQYYYPRGEVLPYISYIGMCGIQGYGFGAALVEIRYTILV